MESGRQRLENVARVVQTPWYVIGAFWILKTDGNFAVHLHNGESLNAQTRLVPRGRPPLWPPPDQQDPWEYSARDALAIYKLTNLNAGIGDFLLHLEESNGTGYRRYGIFSPFIWSGTDLYERGRFGADHVFFPTVVFPSPGAAALLRRLHDKGAIDLRVP